MTKQVRFDTLKPGDCFSYFDEEIQMRTDSGEADHRIVHMASWCLGVTDDLENDDMVTPRPDITAKIKAIVEAADD